MYKIKKNSLNIPIQRNHSEFIDLAPSWNSMHVFFTIVPNRIFFNLN